jgi:hypothetical protein
MSKQMEFDALVEEAIRQGLANFSDDSPGA